MSDAFYGEIRAFGFNYPPLDWASCNGQLVPIHQNPPLASLLGTTYGGDGTTTFGLPNLQGSTPIGAGLGPGLSQRNLGSTVGAGTVTVTTSQIPPHNHTMNAFFPAALTELASVPTANARLSYEDRITPTPPTLLYAYSSNAANTTLAPQALSSFTGSGQQSANFQPYQVFNFCICTQGEYPPHP